MFGRRLFGALENKESHTVDEEMREEKAAVRMLYRALL